MGGDYQTDNTVTGFDANHLIAWKTAPAGTEPPGWEWIWELRAGLGRHRGDPDLRLEQGRTRVPGEGSFPLVPDRELEDSLGNLRPRPSEASAGGAVGWGGHGRPRAPSTSTTPPPRRWCPRRSRR